MTRRARPFLKYTLSAALTFLFLFLAFRGTKFEEISTAIRGANYWWLLLMFVILLMSHLLRSLRWRYLLAPIKSDIGLRNLFSSVMIGYMMNNVLPRAGELARPYSIGKLESIPKSAALGTVVVERIIDTLSFLVLVVLLPLIYDGPLRDTFPWLERAGMVIAIVTFTIIVIMITLMLRRDWTNTLVGLVGRYIPARFAASLERVTHSFLDGFLFLKAPANFLVIVVLSVLVWGLYVAMMYVAFFAFDLPTLGLRAAIVVQAISSIGVAMPTPGATGTYHFFTKETLTALFAVEGSVALSYATVTHAVGFIGITLGGLYFLVRDHIRMSEAVTGESTGDR